MTANPASSKREEDSTPAVSLVDIFLKARELERKGYDVIHFDAGEPDFNPPGEVVDATIRALKEGRGRYTEAGGIPEARKAVADHLSQKYHKSISPNQILLTSGGRLALYYAFLALPPESKVGIISPDWPAYRDMARFLSLPIQFFKTSLENGWEVDPEEIRQSNCNCLVLNYPNNPTGKILNKSIHDEITQVAVEKGITVISDEVYSDYVFDPAHSPKSVLEVPELKSVLATSLSKSYAMTGFRAGYVVADQQTISHLSKVSGMILTSVPEFVQYAIIAAMNCEKYVEEKVAMIKKRRDAAARALEKYLRAEFYLPDGSLYMFPKIGPKGSNFDSEKFALQLLDKEKVSVTPGTSFGSWFRHYVRLTLLQGEERIAEGIERMARVL